MKDIVRNCLKTKEIHINPNDITNQTGRGQMNNNYGNTRGPNNKSITFIKK